MVIKDRMQSLKDLLEKISAILTGGEKMDKAKWTFMVYLAGDNNLSTAGEKDLGEMRTVGSTPQVNIVAEFDRIGEAHETQRYHVQRDGEDERVESLGETDCGDPQVLLDFVKWAAAEYPAERYALVLWNHGGGWEPGEVDRIARSVAARDYSVREASERSSSSLGRAFFRTTLAKVFSLPSVSAREICSDDGSGHSLDTIELGNVLAQTVEILGQPLDLLGMDACLMANLEVAYQARSYVKYIVASEDNEPNDGWPYDSVMRFLVDKPDATTAELASHIVEAYVQSYVERDYSKAVTQSALDLSQMDGLVQHLDALAEVLIPRMDAVKYEFVDTLYATSASFHGGTLWDVAEFCEELAAQTKDDATLQAANAVRSALQPQDDTFVITEAHHGSKVERCGGTTIYLPPRILHKMSVFYSDLAFAQEHQWMPLLEAYHAT